MIHWVWLIIAFAAGMGSTLLAAFISAPPGNPRCTAVLSSGQTCLHNLGHVGPHRTRIYDGGYEPQDYVWEDPKAGLYNMGFFRR
jgi:hypothetical protein